MYKSRGTGQLDLGHVTILAKDVTEEQEWVPIGGMYHDKVLQKTRSSSRQQVHKVLHTQVHCRQDWDLYTVPSEGHQS